MKQLLSLTAITLALLVTPSVTAQYKMTTYQLVMLRKGPSADTGGTPAGLAIV